MKILTFFSLFLWIQIVLTLYKSYVFIANMVPLILFGVLTYDRRLS